MRVLYIASNPDKEGDLLLEKEVTDLQRRLSVGSGISVSFKFLPALPVEEISAEILKFRPTLLHLAAHGDEKELKLANAAKKAVKVTGDLLAALLDVGAPPTLVYLNACNSANVAKAVTSIVPLAIGTTASITNRAARASALVFYERLLSGGTVAQAFRTSNALLTALSQGLASSILCESGTLDPKHTTLLEVPEILARFARRDSGKSSGKLNLQPNSDGDYEFEFGLIGCPPDTTQVVFFTDDDSFILEEEPDDEYHESWRAGWLARVVKGPPVRGTIWSEEPEEAAGDFRIGVAGMTGDNRSFCVSSTICDALDSYLRKGWYGALTKKERLLVEGTIRKMRADDGSQRPEDIIRAGQAKT